MQSDKAVKKLRRRLLNVFRSLPMFCEASFLLTPSFAIIDYLDLGTNSIDLDEIDFLYKDFFASMAPGFETGDIIESIIINEQWTGELFCRFPYPSNFFISMTETKLEGEEVIIVQLFKLARKKFDLVPQIEGNLQKLFGNIRAFLWFENKDFAGSRGIFYSQSVKKITGYSPEEIKNFPGRILNITHNEDVIQVLKSMNEFFNSQQAGTLELQYRITDKGGNLIWVKEFVYSFYGATGKIESLSGLVIDITAEKERELMLAESEAKLLQVNSSKDRFINILSHDLRAPFTSILGFSEILLNEPNLPQTERIEYLTYIYEASQNQLQFINYLLDWSRLRTGRLKLEPQRLTVPGIVYNCISSLTGNAIRKNIEIKTEVPDDLFVMADERFLTQVLMNLLSNAIKFSNSDSIIEISARPFNEKQVEFIVKDHGMGISIEDQQNLFMIDKSFSRDGTKGEKGSGFGLTLVNEIVQKHGGRIWFYSEPEKGTEFHFTINVPTNSIMLIESDEEERNYILALLTDIVPDLEVFTVENGFEAIDLFTERKPDLIVTAHKMPLMSGIQFIETLKSEEGIFTTPVIVLVEELSQDLEAKYIALGAKGIFEHPVNPKEFATAISNSIK